MHRTEATHQTQRDLEASPRRGAAGSTELSILRAVAGVLSIGSGLLHLLFAPGHAAEGSEVGFFFIAVGVSQIVAGSFLWLSPSIPLMLATLAGTVGVIILYVAARTTGLPFGPTAGEVEPVGWLDASTTLLEGALVPLLAYLIGAYRFAAHRVTGGAPPAGGPTLES